MDPAQNYIKWLYLSKGVDPWEISYHDVLSELERAQLNQASLPGALRWWFNDPHTYSTETATRTAAALRLQRMSAQEMTDLGQVIDR